MDESGIAFRRALVRLRQSPRTIEPAEGSFDDPPFRLDFEAAARSANDLDHPQPADHRPRDQGCVGPVDPNDFGKADVTPHQFQHQSAAVAVVDVRGRDDQRPDESQLVSRDVPFAAGDFFSPRRNREVRLVRSISRSGCRRSRPRALGFCPPVAGLSSAGPRESAPRFRRAARFESHKTQCDRAGDRAASPATRRRCGSRRKWHPLNFVIVKNRMVPWITEEVAEIGWKN